MAPADTVVYPAAHSWQESAPEAAQEPIGHASHLSEKAVLEFEYVPSLQGEQDLDPAADQVPGGQNLQAFIPGLSE